MKAKGKTLFGTVSACEMNCRLQSSLIGQENNNQGYLIPNIHLRNVSIKLDAIVHNSLHAWRYHYSSSLYFHQPQFDELSIGNTHTRQGQKNWFQRAPETKRFGHFRPVLRQLYFRASKKKWFGCFMLLKTSIQVFSHLQPYSTLLYTGVVVSQGRPFIMTFYIIICQGYPSLSHFQIAQSQWRTKSNVIASLVGCG